MDTNKAEQIKNLVDQIKKEQNNLDNLIEISKCKASMGVRVYSVYGCYYGNEIEGDLVREAAQFLIAKVENNIERLQLELKQL